MQILLSNHSCGSSTTCQTRDLETFDLSNEGQSKFPVPEQEIIGTEGGIVSLCMTAKGRYLQRLHCDIDVFLCKNVEP